MIGFLGVSLINEGSGRGFDGFTGFIGFLGVEGSGGRGSDEVDKGFQWVSEGYP